MPDVQKLNEYMQWLIIPVFLLIALVLWLLPGSVKLPIEGAQIVSAEQIKPGALRTTLSDPPMAVVNHFYRNCMECHSLFDTAEGARRTTRPNHHHDVIEKMNHGLNEQCINCHHLRDRSKLTLFGDEAIPYSQVELLCAKCHGTVYRDWQRGMHGKILGYWENGRHAPSTLTCTECHDPHAPAFKPMKPLPRPNTLRMTIATQPYHSTGHDVHNPLLQMIEYDADVDNGH